MEVTMLATTVFRAGGGIFDISRRTTQEVYRLSAEAAIEITPGPAPTEHDWSALLASNVDQRGHQHYLAMRAHGPGFAQRTRDLYVSVLGQARPRFVR
jgi:hypothetical protein